ncbi:hypothetical protein AURDEDRAFT_127542 [Auricularia subglabra TFB-10046 SS5]|nr:hypothetical protein AURDEDRAFT_127542 [Auricularia subglabra TFB-10046 SS5]
MSDSSQQGNRPPTSEADLARDDEVQAAWASWDPSTEMPAILSNAGRTTSGWDHDELAPIYAALDRAWGPLPGAAPVTDAPTPSSTNGNYDSDESENGLPSDDDFPDPLEDRDFLEFVLFQRACAERRAASGLPAIACTRHEPCCDCNKHEGAYFPRTLWQVISDEALEHHVGNYLTIRPWLPPWQPSRPSNLQAPQLVFGSAQTPPRSGGGNTAVSQGDAPRAAAFGPEPPLEFHDSLEDVSDPVPDRLVARISRLVALFGVLHALPYQFILVKRLLEHGTLCIVKRQELVQGI